MSIKIHHGPPGSYKTSSAIESDFIPALISKRPIITNVRGLDNPELILSVLRKQKIGYAKKRYPDLPSIDEIEIIHIDTTTHDNREHLRNFIRWAPVNSFFIIDEINTIFPTDWRTNKLKEYDYPGGVDQAKEDGRPPNLQEAFEMHRHYNWDFVLTTPNINKVHAVVRDCAEMSYCHRNRATIGLKGTYWLIIHPADTTGKNKQDQLSYSVERIPAYVFKMYKSTSTGEVRDTLAGFNIFTQPKVIGVACLLVFLLGYNFYNYKNSTMGKSKDLVDSEKVIKEPIVQNNNTVANNQKLRPVNVSYEPVKKSTPLQDYVLSILEDDELYYSGRVFNKIILQKSDDETAQSFVFDLDNDLDLKFRTISMCFVEIKYYGSNYYYRCPPNDISVPGEQTKMKVL